MASSATQFVVAAKEEGRDELRRTTTIGFLLLTGLAGMLAFATWGLLPDRYGTFGRLMFITGAIAPCLALAC